MKYEIIWDNNASNNLDKLEFFIQKRIIKKIDDLAQNFSFHNIKRIIGTNEYRFRVGDYRIIFEIKDNLIRVLKIGHRKNIYKN